MAPGTRNDDARQTGGRSYSTCARDMSHSQIIPFDPFFTFSTVTCVPSHGIASHPVDDIHNNVSFLVSVFWHARSHVAYGEQAHGAQAAVYRDVFHFDWSVALWVSFGGVVVVCVLIPLQI
jgi:hypothetical protein